MQTTDLVKAVRTALALEEKSSEFSLGDLQMPLIALHINYGKIIFTDASKKRFIECCPGDLKGSFLMTELHPSQEINDGTEITKQLNEEFKGKICMSLDQAIILSAKATLLEMLLSDAGESVDQKIDTKKVEGLISRCDYLLSVEGNSHVAYHAALEELSQGWLEIFKKETFEISW